jgi:hypothetical protein
VLVSRRFAVPSMSGDASPRLLTVLHVAMINKPITPRIGYGLTEAGIGNIDKGPAYRRVLDPKG